MDSEELAQALEPGRFRIYQVPVATVEKLTELSFGDLKESDVFAASENSIFLSESAERGPRLLESLKDVWLGHCRENH